MQNKILETFCFNIAIMKIKGKGSSKYQIPVNILNWAIKKRSSKYNWSSYLQKFFEIK